MNSLRALAVASILAAGCVAPQSGQEPIQSPPRSTYTEAQRMVGPRPENLQNGYFTSPFSRSTMTTIAGVYAGTVQVQRTQSGTVVRTTCQGEYSQFRNPEAMDRACKDADLDSDHILTDQEVRALARRVLK